MKTYYKVVSQFRNNGTIKADMDEVQAESKPESIFTSNDLFDMYTDYFEDKKDALEIINDCKKESR